jgi:DNA-binding SARP family transcriptional activator/predicted ATPase
MHALLAPAELRMLKLLQTPVWSSGVGQHDLPDTVPGWLVAFLALQADWVSRDRAATVFWPEAGNAEALNNLRANLHRARQLLGTWSVGDRLQSERRRVYLNLPTDVAQLRAAISREDWPLVQSLYRHRLLQGLSFPGSPALQEWVEIERAELHAQWREAMLKFADGPDTAPAQALDTAVRMLAFDPLDEEAVARQIRALARCDRATEAVQIYGAHSRRLADELGARPSATLQRLAASLPQQVDEPLVRVVADLPVARDAFVGRRVELEQLRAMLGQSGMRVITVLGPGGVGKSRIARELASAEAARFRDGSCWVALAAVQDLNGALASLATAVGLVLAPSQPYADQLQHALERSERLVVLDNAESVSGLGAWLAAQASSAINVRWIVTSQVPLSLPQERIFEMEGLEYPAAEDDHLSPEQAREHDAVRLLEARVRVFRPDFDIGRQLQACLALVRRVGGWPLAIEIAATALALQPAVAVLADLEQSLDTLAAGQAPGLSRHHSVQASLQLSWQMLEPMQRCALAGLSVFRQSFTRASALAVIPADGAALAVLIDRLLVHSTGSGRWALHPLVRQFAGAQLAADAETAQQVQTRHAEHFLRELATLGNRGDSDATAVANAIEADLENFRAAWRWAVERQTTSSMAAAAWTYFCDAKGRAREVAQLLETALGIPRLDPATQAALLLALSNARYRAGDNDDAVALAEQALAFAQVAADAVRSRCAMNLLALALVQLGRVDEAESHARIALMRAREAGAEGEVAQIANTCAIVAKNRGDFAAAAALYQEAIASHRRRGNMRSLATTLNNLGNIWRARENLDEAPRCFEECLRVCEQHGIVSTHAFALGNLGLVAYQEGRVDAAQLYAERTLAERGPEPAMTLAAHGLLARVALDRGNMADAAEHVQRLARLAHGVGMHMAMLEAVHCHAVLLAAQGQHAEARSRFSFVLQHPRAAAMARMAAAAALDGMNPGDEERTSAGVAARALDLDVLLDAAAHARMTVGPLAACAQNDRSPEQ